jgi:DNA processing protein
LANAIIYLVLRTLKYKQNYYNITYLETNLRYNLGLSLINGIGPVLARQLLNHFTDSAEIFKAKKKDLINVPGMGDVKANCIKKWDNWQQVDNEINFIEKHGITCHWIQNKSYPNKLLQCADAPILLYQKGNGSVNENRMISIVGKRKHTDYGKRITEEIIEHLKTYNVTIVSGLAIGIDIIAHKQALQLGLPTIGVLAHGLDRIYPPNHRTYAKEMLLHGGLLTEYISGTNPDKENFPTRNRIVAGMTDATIVIETDIKGGSMITAQLANSYNKEVLAVPGSIYANTSQGCNYLIKKHQAHILSTPNDIVELLNWDQTEKKQKVIQPSLFLNLSKEEQTIVDILHTNGEQDIDTLTSISSMNSSILASTLLSLELQNIISALPGKRYKLY